jgi:hypothetical protein
MRRKRNIQFPFHWSKDYVEHLRTIHFALIAVSIGLIVVLISSTSYSPSIARREIYEILELKQLWSPNWIEANGRTTGRSLSEPKKEGDEPVDEFYRKLFERNAELDFSLKNKKLFARQYKRKKSGALERNNITVMLLLPENDWQVVNTKNLGVTPTVFCATLSDFRLWWNSLGTPYAVNFPSRIGEFGFRGTVSGIFTLVNLSDRYSENFEAEAKETIHLFLNANVPEGFFSFDSIATGLNSVTIPILKLNYSETDRSTLNKTFQSWGSGEFENSFYNLDQATRDNKTLTLEDIAKIVSEDAAKGPEVFEVFGLKFPQKHITIWGIVILLGVQLYLFVYLRQLTGHMGADDPGWDVPWIALDQSALGRSLLFLTVTVLPCIASALIGINFMQHFVHQPFEGALPKSMADALVRHPIFSLVFVCSFSASAVLGILSWKHRPSEPIARHTPTFE